MLLCASYYFYAAWDWRFLSLLLLSTVVDYICSNKIEQSDTKSRKKLFVTISVMVNLSVLGFFKYFNFFADTLQELTTGFGMPLNAFTLEIILPMGISFYTFQTMSYTIDVYRGELKAEPRGQVHLRHLVPLRTKGTGTFTPFSTFRTKGTGTKSALILPIR